VFDLLDDVRHIAQGRDQGVPIDPSRSGGDGVYAREVMSQAPERSPARAVL
jgi:hypothetical protein